jgi:hypothetical protein
MAHQPSGSRFQHMHDAAGAPPVDPRHPARIARKMRREPRELSLIQPEMIVIHDCSPFGPWITKRAGCESTLWARTLGRNPLFGSGSNRYRIFR